MGDARSVGIVGSTAPVNAADTRVSGMAGSTGPVGIVGSTIPVNAVDARSPGAVVIAAESRFRAGRPAEISQGASEPNGLRRTARASKATKSGPTRLGDELSEGAVVIAAESRFIAGRHPSVAPIAPESTVPPRSEPLEKADPLGRPSPLALAKRSEAANRPEAAERSEAAEPAGVAGLAEIAGLAGKAESAGTFDVHSIGERE
ncbi:hypothetical protein Dvina_45915 [Dactylosporangium vinaceum]|uniref:Uncharacterized protein n=1 Tax=Dactylosporangium vinaceum TaxID=53362 RepID=A0ABV5LYM7_9ACTN|nr:hypothetical protein [Dactylosporangium vinaceum]UAB95297.1 hypothetical protein Dvina_45915 [Dactylosporangium vinaceum]